MGFETVVNDVRSRVEGYAAHGQKLVKTSLESVKQGGEIVLEGLQSLLDNHTSAAKEIFASAKSGLEKARSDGLKAVASSPISYLPPKEKFVGLFSDTAEVFSKTSDELVKTFKQGYDSLKAEFDGSAQRAARGAKRTVRKGRAAASKTVRKTANRAAKAAQ